MRVKKAGAVAPLALGLLCAPLIASAQSPSPIVPQDRPDQGAVRAPEAQAAPAPASAAPALPQIAPFQLQRVEVVGSSLSPETLQAAWRPFQGRTLGAPGVVEVTDALIAAYERSDIALYTVLVPSQDFQDGVLRIRVLEGYVESIAVEGASGSKARSLVERHLERLKQERPLTKTTLQRHVSLARDLPGVRTDLRFVTGAADGAVGVVAEVDAEPVQLGFSANNRGAAFLGRTQVGADLYLNNLIAGGQTRLSVAAPTDLKRFQYVAVSHNQLLGLSGASLQASLGYLRTRPRELDLKGEAKSAGLQVTYPLLRSYERDLYLTAGVDGLNANSVLVGNQFSDDRTRAARLSALYVQQTPISRLSLSGATSFGLDVLGARTLIPELTEVSFAKFNARLGYARQLRRNLFVRLAAAGQWTDDRLPPSEQFGLGGHEFGRGFEAAALTGDQAYAASAEFAYRPQGLPAMLQDGEAYGFVDGGQTFYMRRAFVPAQQDDLSSFGAGIRATIRERLALQVEATKPISSSSPVLDRRGERLVFSVRSVW